MPFNFTESQPVVIRFEIDGYSDALHFVDAADRAQYTDGQILAMMQARYDNWQAAISAVPPAPTSEELQARLDALVAQQAATQEQIVTLAPPEVVVPILEAQAVQIAEQIAALGGQG